MFFIYKGDCFCGSRNIGETKHNAVHVTLVQTNVMQKFGGINVIIQLKVQNHENTFKVTATTILYHLSCQMTPKISILGRT